MTIEEELRRWNKTQRHARYIGMASDRTGDTPFTIGVWQGSKAHTVQLRAAPEAQIQLYVLGATECALWLREQGFRDITRTPMVGNPLQVYFGENPKISELIHNSAVHEQLRRLLPPGPQEDNIIYFSTLKPDRSGMAIQALDHLLKRQYDTLVRLGYMHLGDGQFDVH